MKTLSGTIQNTFTRTIKHNLFIKLLLSFGLVTIIPIIISFIVYFLTSGLLRSELTRVNYTLLTQVQSEIDSRIQDIHRMFDQLTTNPDLRAITAAKENDREARRFLVHRAVNELSRLTLINSFIDGIFIHYGNQDTILSNLGYIETELFHNLYIQSNFGADGFRTLIGRQHVRSDHIMATPSGCRILFMQTFFLPAVIDVQATIVVSVREETIRQYIKSSVANDGNIVMVSAGGSLISTTSAQAGTPPAGDYIHISSTSDITGWVYSVFIPTHIFYSGARQLQMYTLLGLLISAILCSFVVYILSKINYRPVRNLIGIFQNHTSVEYKRISNEYEWIAHNIEAFLVERADMKRAELKNKRTQTLRRALKGHIDACELAGLDEINLPGEFYSVVVFFMNESVLSPKSSLFILLNVFGEMAAAHFAVQTCEVDEAGVAILSHSAMDEGSQAHAKRLANEVMAHVKAHFDMDILVTLGNTYKGLEGIRASFLEAREAAEYRNILDRHEVIHFADINNSHKWYYYPIEVEQRIYNSLKVGNAESAINLLEDVFVMNFANKEHVSATIRRHVVDEITGTLLKAAGAGNYAILDEINRLRAKKPDSTRQAEQHLAEIMRRICEHVSNIETLSKDTGLSRDVAEYIKKHYSDSNLNVTMLARAFELTPTYISKLFKEQTGEGLLSHINRIRIEAAKGFLHEGKSVSEAAALSGFASLGTMTRLFKKVTGVTPGQVRKL